MHKSSVAGNCRYRIHLQGFFVAIAVDSDNNYTM